MAFNKFFLSSYIFWSRVAAYIVEYIVYYNESFVKVTERTFLELNVSKLQENYNIGPCLLFLEENIIYHIFNK